MTPIIEVRGLVNRFGEQVVHDGLNMQVMPGQVLGIVGGSGSGKSVLLRTILGLNRQAAGQILFEGRDMDAMDMDEQVKLRQRWGVLFQSSALFSSLNVGDNIAFPMREFTRLTASECEDMVRIKLHLVGLSPDAADKYPAELSGGMKKRAALARALALDPPVIFLDEPTSGLDPISAGAFDELILYLRETLGLTVIIITHDLDSLYAICDHVAVLVDKQIIVDTLEGHMNNPHPWIQAYFHGTRARAAFSGRG
jgi:phospholipid/cholesterol/gamma-HCH transport system ATP-binding protein